MLGHAAIAAGLLFASIVIGVAGYMAFERLPASDAFLNTCQLLGGVGPSHAPATEGGKVFAGLFALYAGLVFVAAISFLLAPVAHRLLHRFHRDGSR